MSSCVGRGPSALLCPGAYNAVKWPWVYITWDLLAATITASAFPLIGPAVGYAGVRTHAESVCQNSVLGRCANLCLIVVLH